MKKSTMHLKLELKTHRPSPKQPSHSNLGSWLKVLAAALSVLAVYLKTFGP